MLVLPAKSQQIRALADCDSFFACCEVARNPALKGLPVCVGRLWDIIVASTYEAKRFGVTTGTPSREAKRMLPKNAVFLPPDMWFYGRMSEKVFSCLAEYVDELEQFSIDEAFIVLPPSLAYDELSASLYVDFVQQKLYKRTWLPVTFGVAPTRLLAKTFAKLGKPFWYYVALEEENIIRTAQQLELTKTPFIGERMAAKVCMCRTIYDFMWLDGVIVRKRMGRAGMKLRLELNGINALSIERQWPPSIISRCRSFHPHFTNDKKFLRTNLIKNFEKAYHQLMDQHCSVRTLKVYFKTKEFTKRRAKKRLPRATADKAFLLTLLRQLFDQAYSDQYLYRTTGIVLTELETANEYKQHSILDYEEENKLANQKKILEVIDLINNKRGGQIITTAANMDVIRAGKRLEIGGVVR